MKKRSLTIRKFFSCALLASFALFTPQITTANSGITADLLINKADVLIHKIEDLQTKAVDLANTIASQVSEQTKSLGSGIHRKTLEAAAVAEKVVSNTKHSAKLVAQRSTVVLHKINNSFKETEKVIQNVSNNIADNGTLAIKSTLTHVHKVVSNTTDTVTSSSKKVTSTVGTQSASVMSSLDGGLEKVYGFAIDKTADVLTPFFVDSKKNVVPTLIIKNISKNTDNQSSSVSKKVSPAISNTITNSNLAFNQNILRRLTNLENKQAAFNPINQFVTNNYITASEYTRPADTSTYTNSIVSSSVNSAVTTLQSQIDLIASGDTFSTSTTRSVFSAGAGIAYNALAGEFTIATSTLNTADIAEGSNLYFTNSRADDRADLRIGLATTTIQAMVGGSVSTSTIREMFSSTATGLTYTNSTGDFSLTSGYSIPLTASTTEWASKVSSQWTTSGSNIYYNTGNVGIGTTTPSAKLQVSGGSILVDNAQGIQFAGGANTITNTSSVLTFRTGSTNQMTVQAGYVSIGTATTYGALGVVGTNLQAGLVVLAPSAPTLDIFAVRNNANNNNYLGVSSAGNVGIGTTTPSAKLAVEGAGLFNGAVTATNFTSNSTTLTSAFSGPVTIGGSGTATKLSVAAGASMSTNLASISSVHNIGSNSVLALSYSGADGGRALSVTDGAYNSAAMLITKTSGAVTTATEMSGFLVNSTYAHTNTGTIGNGGKIVAINNTSPTGILYGLNVSATANLATAVGLNVTAASSGGTTYAALFNGGNVGIGSTTPSKKLSVDGDISLTGGIFDNTASAGSNGYVLQSTGTGIQWVATSTLGITGGGGSSQWTTSGSNIYYNTGNVGIGTTTPTTKLGVNGSVQIFDTTPSTGVTTLTMRAGAGQSSTNILEVISNSGTSLMSYSGGGAFTLSAGSTFTFASNLTMNSAGFRQKSNSVVGWASATDNSTASDVALSRLSSGVLGVGTGAQGSVAGTLVANSIGIGTTTPSAKLAITGSGTGTGNAFIVANSLNANKFIVQDNGNITIAGTARLGTSGEPGRQRFYDSSGYLMSFWDTSADYDSYGMHWNTTTDSISFKGSDSVKMSVSLSTGSGYFAGNFGAANSSPDEALTVGSASESQANRKAIKLGVGGYAAPGNFSTDSYGDKIIFYNGVDFDGRFGVSGGAEVWTKIISTQADPNLGSFSVYTTNGTQASPTVPKLRANVGGSGQFALGGIITSYSNYTGATLVGTSAGNIGIGTTTPSAKLAITGTAGAGDIFTVASSTNASLFKIGATGATYFNNDAGTSGYVLLSNGANAAPTWVATSTLGITGGGGGGSGTVNSGTAGQVAFYNSTGTAVSGTSTLFFSNGNIGIGTTTPSNSLSVQAPFGTVDIGTHSTSFPGIAINNTYSGVGSSYGGFMRWQKNGVNQWGYGMDVSGAGGREFWLYNYVNSKFAFYTDMTSTNFTIGAGSAASSQLGVSGNATIGSGYLATVAPANGLLVQGQLGLGNSPDSGAKLTIQAINPAGGSAIWQTFKNSAGTTKWGISEYSSGDMNFYEAGVADARLYLKAGGNVGIGISNPSSKLHVVGSDGTGNAVVSKVTNTNTSDASYAAFVMNVGSGSEGGAFFGSKAALASAGIVNGITMSPGTSAQDIGFRVGSAVSGAGNGEAMIIKSTGNVGIGSTTPSAKLSIKGVGTGTGINLQTTNSSDSPLFTVLDNGNVGIGIAAPTSKLHVVGSDGTGNGVVLRVANTNTSDSSYATFAMNVGSGSEGGAFFGSKAALPIYGIVNGITMSPGTSAQDIGFRVGSALSGASNGASLIIKSTGNVGIGTSTPLYRFEVASSTASNYVARIINTGNATAANGLIIQGGENTTGGATFTDFRINNGTSVGGITQVGNTGVLYNTTSDLRAKENIVATHYGLVDLMNIKVSDYNFIADAQKRVSTGVIAQELYEIFPEAVSKPADESLSMWAVDYGRITPLIIKSVQDLSKIFDELKSKVEGVLVWFSGDAGQFNVRGQICVDDVCVTKDQFKQMLLNSGASYTTGTINTNTNTNTNAGDGGTNTSGGGENTSTTTDSGNSGSTTNTDTLPPPPESTPEPTPPTPPPAPVETPPAPAPTE